MNEPSHPIAISISCACGWRPEQAVPAAEALRVLDEHLASDEHGERDAAQRRRFYDLTPRFPVVHDGQTVAWCIDEETQAFLQSVLDGDVWDAKEIRALAEQYRSRGT